MKTKSTLDQVIFSVCKKNSADFILSETTNLVQDLGFSSIGLMELVIRIEEEFNIEVTNDFFDIKKLSDYNWLLKSLRKLLQEDCQEND